MNRNYITIIRIILIPFVFIIFCKGIISIPIPEELKSKTISPKSKYSWKIDKNSIALVNMENIVWQYNFDKKEGKPYFHPLAFNDGTVLTWHRPEDHPWHLGLWFSWQYYRQRHNYGADLS
jgi:hypothetical protein